jgi:hypothetical protein
MNVWHPDAVLEVPALGIILEGRDQARMFFGTFLEAVRGYHGEVVNLGVDGETVIADCLLHGTTTGPLLGVEPTGTRLVLPIVSVAAIRDGLFVSETLRFDLSTLARQAQLPLEEVLNLAGRHQDPPVERTAATVSQPDDGPVPEPRLVDDIDAASDRSNADANAFLDVFVEGWRQPRSLQQFLDHFLPHVDPEVRLRQPLGEEHGHSGFERVFRRLFTLMPDIHGEVCEVFTRLGGLLIVLRMEGSLGRSRYSWTIIDRITLRDARLVERQAYFNPLPLFGAIVRRPSAWPRALRSLLA